MEIVQLRKIIRLKHQRIFNNKTIHKKNGAGGETNSGAFFYGCGTTRAISNTSTTLIHY